MKVYILFKNGRSDTIDNVNYISSTSDFITVYTNNIGSEILMFFYSNIVRFSVK